MVKRTLDLEEEILSPDNMAKQIAAYWRRWDLDRQSQIDIWQEISRYLFATDTRHTSNAKLPWKNSTVTPKLCQIRDNLYANYRAVIFPKRKWLKWFPDNRESLDREKSLAVQDYITYATEQTAFKQELDKSLYDYIDYGNAFSLPDWVDYTVNPTNSSEGKVGYVGPRLMRISPLDTVMNPTATSINETPFVVRSWMTIGQLRKQMDSLTGGEREAALEAFKYLVEVRRNAGGHESDLTTKDEIYNVAGFNSFRDYLGSAYVELLTFYGDIYNIEDDEYLENYIITIADRHKIVSARPNESSLGTVPIIHSGWRKRQDNLWAMGPLENLVGMQYRIDHIENLKADVWDFSSYPMQKIKGIVEDYVLEPGGKIFIPDANDGDVEFMGPDVSILQSNIELDVLMQKMEEMAGAPKEALGFRTPGEKTAFEVQRLENASSRIFVNKASQFEEEFVEKGLNGMLELARRKADSTLVRVFDDENKIFQFRTLSKEDISGAGRIKPIGARHFAEQSELVQNLTNFSNSSLGQDPAIKVHMSGKSLARLFEDVLNVQDYNVFSEYVQISEQAEMEQMMQQAQEDTIMQAQTPSGLTPDDFDPDLVGDEPEEEEPIEN